MPIINHRSFPSNHNMLRFFSLFCFLVLLSACTNSYHEHFWRENIDSSQTSQSTGSLWIADGRLESLPNTTTQWSLIDSINWAKHRVWIEIYTWTDAAKLTDPIISAHKRWVDVVIALEGNVFGTPQINTPVFKKLKSAGIRIVYTDNHRYTFTHAKFWIIDDTYSISTGNWTASFFTKNREYIYSGTDLTTLSFLEDIFVADTSHLGYKDLSRIPDHIVISPLDARSKILGLIASTQSHILLYIQTLNDEEILGSLDTLIASGKTVEICTADNESNQVRKLQFPTWKWHISRKPYIHAKVIIVDWDRVFIGSHNLTTNALENNREIGIILRDRDDIVSQIELDFVRDGCR